MTDQAAQQQIATPQVPFDSVFPRLVSEDEAGQKLLGFISYGLYQEAKREWISDFHTRQQRYPSDEELCTYERSWTTSRLESLKNAAAQVISAYTDSVVSQAERQILRSALKGSYWRAVSRWVGGALLYTLLPCAFVIGLSRSGIDVLTPLQKIVCPR